MKSTALMIWSLLFGAVGVGFFSYGARQKLIVPWLVGTALIIDPWFIANAYVLVAVGILLIEAAWWVRL